MIGQAVRSTEYSERESDPSLVRRRWPRSSSRIKASSVGPAAPIDSVTRLRDYQADDQ